jgi:hypothetical protein
MYVVMIFEAAHEDLRNIVAYVSNENPDAAETLGRELLDQARTSRLASKKTARSLKTHPWELSNLLPDQGTKTGCRDHSFQAWRTAGNLRRARGFLPGSRDALTGADFSWNGSERNAGKVTILVASNDAFSPVTSRHNMVQRP